MADTAKPDISVFVVSLTPLKPPQKPTKKLPQMFGASLDMGKKLTKRTVA